MVERVGINIAVGLVVAVAVVVLIEVDVVVSVDDIHDIILNAVRELRGRSGSR